MSQIQTYLIGGRMELVKKMTVLLLVVMIALVIYYGQSIKKELRAIQEENASLYQNYLNQTINHGNHVLSSMENLILENNNFIVDYKHKILNVDLAGKSGEIEFEVIMKEVGSNRSIVGQFEELGGTDSYPVEFERLEGLTYRTIINLDLDKNYKLQLYEVADDGATRQLNNNQISLHLYNEFYANRIQSLGSSTTTSADRIVYQHSFGFTGEKIEGADIDKVILEAMDEQQNVIAEFDITSSVVIRTNHNAELEDQYRLALASGQLAYEMTFQEYLAEFGYALEDTEAGIGTSSLQYSVEKTLTEADLPEYWDLITNGNYYFTLKVIFEDGIEIKM